MLRRAWVLGLALACSGPTSTGETDHTDVVDTGPTDATDDTDVGWQDPPVEVIPGAPVLWSHDHGVYDTPFTLTLTAPSDRSEIRYSLDGTDPTDGGTLYQEPLSITSTTVIRATVVDDAVGPSPVQTRTFVFPADVADQVRPEAWPEVWWVAHEEGPFAADYEVDPDVVEPDPAAFERALRDAPIVSIAVSPDDLFDPDTGIHENSEEGGWDWERVASVEMFGPDETIDVTTTCGLRAHGGAGRRPTRSPKKSFRLAFRGQYGDGMLDVPLFREPTYAGEAVDRFDTLVLRAGYNRSWAHYEANQRRKSQYLHESLGTALHRQMGRPAPRIRLVHLFIDGLYWGVYQAEERPDAAFMASRWGGSEEDYDSLNVGEPSEGDTVAWLALLDAVRADLSVPANVQAVEDLLDVDAFIDYHLLQLTLGNLDWPRKNWWVGRLRDGGRFHFFVWDAELIMSRTTDSRIDDGHPDGPGEIFQALRASPEFRVRFGDAVQRHLVEADGPLHPDRWRETWLGLHPEAPSVLVAESARWGDHWRDVRADPEAELYTVAEHWVPENAHVADFYIPRRTPLVVEDLRAAGLYPALDPPRVFPEPGRVEPGTILTAGAAGQVFATTDGSDPRLPGGGLSDAAIELGVDGLRLDEDTTVVLRARDGELWSARRELSWTVGD